MKLSTRARYSIRLMIYLADNSGNGKPVQLGEIARNQKLSLRYLEQLVMPLKSANLIKSVHGKHGGYYLARDAREISINEIIEASIGPIRLLDCLGADTECGFEDHCGSHRLWGLINHKITDVLKQYMLADLSEKDMRIMLSESDIPDGKARARTC